MLALNTFCMETEDKLRKAEAEKKFNLVNKYDYLLGGVKIVATNQINARFPELKYRKTELQSYEEEVKQRKISNPEHWLNQLVYNLEEMDEVDTLLSEAVSAAKKAAKEGKSSDDAVSEAVKEAIKIEPKVDETKSQEVPDKTTSAAPSKKSVEKNKTEKAHKDCPKNIELFVPKEYSAKGFVSIGGMDDLKDKISDKIILPLKDPETAKLDEVEYGKKMPRGELLFGPPGCGKTYFAEAIAQETGLPMYKLKISNIGSSYVNGSSKNLQEAYAFLKSQANATGKPVIMFIDEIETFTAKRDESGLHAEDNKLLGTFLQIMDDARVDNVFVVGATNLINMMDPAIASRFDSKDYVEIPKNDTRRVVLQMMLNRFTKGQSLANNPEELEKVVQRTAGFSNRTLGVIVNEAADIARKDGRRSVIAEDFIKPIEIHTADKIRNESIYMDKNTTPKIGFAK